MPLNLPVELSEYHERLAEWFDHNARSLPWREADCSPWGVMVSEFMLQQTPVVRVLPRWYEWLERWPTPADLAAEPAGEAIRAWGRLGYPRRALRLHAAATTIATEYANEVPRTEEELLALPGVGAYTAAAIASFAYDVPTTVIDTNIRRVHARAFAGMALPEPSLTKAERERAELVKPTDPELANQWNAATMELGALVCTARKPACDACPLLDICAWQLTGCPEPHYTPKGHPWHGTDRQLRGALVQTLREEHGCLPVTELLGAVDFAWADHDRKVQCLNGLVADGLVELTGENLERAQLPS
ncbi:A/G-specific adenine glycosylase [Micrococcoides hystricis]|uniref:Adenine DNA glycosylase n=1 Tax=Micrococcoides hystricis TaxID=1572761 RepID=A0ABV6PB47_9MICC